MEEGKCTAMNLKEKLTEDMKRSMKSAEKLRLSTIRLVLSEIRNAEIEKRGELTEEELMTVLSREAKQRRESIDEFKKGGREDLVEKESFELQVLHEYLPEQISEEELRSIVRQTVDEVGASSPGDIGKVMAELMPKVRGKADGKHVNQLVREILG